MLYDPGALGDLTYNDLIYEGVERAAIRHGLRTRQLSPRNREEGLRYLSGIFDLMENPQDTVRQLLVVAGSSYDQFLRANNRRLESNPRADLLYFETTRPLEGKGSSLHIRFYGAMFEAGVVTPFYSSEALVVAANPYDTGLKDAVDGFREGFATDYVDGYKSKQLFVDYIADTAGSGFSIDDSSALDLMFNQPWTASVRYIVPVCGGASAVFLRLAERFGAYGVVGIDRVINSSECSIAAVKHSDKAVELCIGQWLSEEGMPKHQSLGLAEGYSEMVFCTSDPSTLRLTESFYPLETREIVRRLAAEKEASYGE